MPVHVGGEGHVHREERGLAMAFNSAEYETVAERLSRFKKDNENFRMESEVVAHTALEESTRWVVKVSLWRDANEERCTSTGFAEERDGGQGANRAAALENCESSALGRALANAGYAGSKRVTREEMAKTIAVDDIERAIPSASKDELRELWKRASDAGVLPQVQKKIKDQLGQLEAAQ